MTHLPDPAANLPEPAANLPGPAAILTDPPATGSAADPRRTPNRRTRVFALGGVDRTLALIIAAGALIRIVYWLDKWNRVLSFNDSIYYSGQARQLNDGVWFREIFVDLPAAEHGPLTSILMALVSWGSNPFPWQRSVTVACGIATMWVVAKLGTRLGGRRVGLIAATIAAFSPNFWMNDGLVMSESVSILCVALTLWWAIDIRATSAASMVRLGVALGLSTLARSELVLLIPLVVAVVALSHRRGGASLSWKPLISVGVAVAVLAPWMVFNLSRFERPVFLTTNDGTTWMGANCDETWFGENQGGWSLACAFENFDSNVEPSVRSAGQRDVAGAYVRARLTTLPRVIAARVGRTLDLYGLSSLVEPDVGDERPRWASWAGIFVFWATAMLAAFGWRRSRRGDRWLLACPMVVVMAVTVVFYGGHRIRSSAEVSLALLAALGVNALARRQRNCVPIGSESGTTGTQIE